METIIQYFIQTLRDMAKNPAPLADPITIAFFIASPHDRTGDRRELALAIEAWALAYAAKKFATIDTAAMAGYVAKYMHKAMPRFEPGQRVRVIFGPCHTKLGNVERVVDTPSGRFYNVVLDEARVGALTNLVQVSGDDIEAI
jgi:hypothetical protein